MTADLFPQSPPEPLVLHPSRWRWGLMALLCAVFVMIGIGAVQRHWGGWLVIAFFGGGLFIVLLNLLPGASHLAIDAHGFRMRSLFRGYRFAWSDIAAFGVTSIGMNSYVGFNYANGYPAHRRLRRLNAGLSGYEAAIPDTYGLGAATLAELLQRWHRHAGAAASFTPTDETADASV